MKTRIFSILIITISVTYFCFFSANSISARVGTLQEAMCKITGEVTEIFQIDHTNDEYQIQGYPDKWVGLKIKILDKKSYNNESSKEICNNYELNSIISVGDESKFSINNYFLSTGDIFEADIYYDSIWNVEKKEDFNFYDFLHNNIFYITGGLVLVILVILLLIIKNKKRGISSDTQNPPSPPSN